MGQRSSRDGERPLATLAVKGYNQEGTIRDAVAAAFAQSYSPLEIVLSDDASEDATFGIMQEMAAGYVGRHRVVLNRNPMNLGIVGNMNRVAEIASGRLLVEASGDDVSQPFRVERLVAAWLAGGGRTKALHSRFIEVDGEGRILGDGGPERVVVDAPGPDPLTVVRSGANCIGATAAWDRELFERFGPIPDYCDVEDGVLFFRAAMLDGIAFVEEPLIYYRTGGISRLRPTSPGYDYLYGDRIKFARWRLHNARAFLSDMEKVDFPAAAECQRVLCEIVEKYGYEVGLADSGPLSRMGAVPLAAARSLREREQFYLTQSLKHALGPAYVAYFNARQGGPRKGGPRRGKGPAKAA